MAASGFLQNPPWIAFARRRRERRLVDAGNAARDSRDWPIAVAHYRSYLELRPDSFAIWVQSGHALKESGRLEEAHAAYTAAQQIDGEDADLFLQIGHLLKLMNRRSDAVAAYLSCVRLGGSLDAQVELSRLGVVVSAQVAAPTTVPPANASSRTPSLSQSASAQIGPQPKLEIILSRRIDAQSRKTLRQSAGRQASSLAIHEPTDDAGLQWDGEQSHASLASVDAVIRRSDADFVAIAMADAAPDQGWCHAFQNAFLSHPLAFAAVGLVVNAQNAVIFGGSRVAGPAGVIPADTGKAADSYLVRSCEQLDALQPGFIAVATDVFRELGGFALSFATVEEELLDLSARARVAGYQIVRCPGAVQVLPPAAAESLEIKLPSAPASAALAGVHRRRPSVLVVDHRTPTPDQDSGSVDTFWAMRTLKSLGYEVTFIPYYETCHAGRYTSQLEDLGIRCPVDRELVSPEAFLRQHGAEFDAIFLYRVVVAYRLLDLCREVAPRAKVAFFTVDLHFLREERIAAQSGRPEDAAQAAGTKTEELRCIRGADATLVVSDFEYDLVGELAPEAKRYLIPVMHPAPGRLGPRDRRDGILFVGGFGHAPNLDAVKYLCEEIWPRVRRAMPGLTLHIAGSNPPESVRAYARADQGVEVLGFVADLYPYYRRCVANVAPLRYGAGVKGKVVAALLVGLPTIATPIAVEGMGLADGEDVIVGRDAGQFADAIVRVASDDALWKQLSDSGLRVAQRNFSVDAQVPRLRHLLQELDLPC
jgi:glycosyltransferase involved in cell wall biosynthesis